MKDIFKEPPFEPLPPLGPISDPSAVEVSDAALEITGLNKATDDGRLHAIDLVTDLGLAQIVVFNSDRTDKDTNDSNTELEA